MKVCIVGSLPLPIGGVANHCYNLSKQLYNLGAEVTFFDTNPNPNKNVPKEIYDYEMLSSLLSFYKIYSILSLGYSRVFLHLLNTLFRNCFEYKNRLKLRGIRDVCVIALFLFIKLSRKRVDLIHTQHAYPRSLSALLVGRALDIPVVITIHASELTSMDSEIKILKPLAVNICNAADYVISVSQQTKAVANKAGVTNKIEVIYNGVDASFHGNYDVTDLKKRYNLANEKIILYVGWLIERKGPQILLEAITKLKKQNFKVFIIGPDHGLKDKLESYIKKLNLNQVHLVGVVDDIILKKFYSLADIFVFPTITEDEGFGLVAVEAMASKTVVIGSKIAAIPEIVRDNESGFLFIPRDSDDLANKIDMILGNDKLLYEMKLKAADFVKQNFSWKFVAEHTLHIYKKVIFTYNLHDKNMIRNNKSEEQLSRYIGRKMQFRISRILSHFFLIFHRLKCANDLREKLCKLLITVPLTKGLVICPTLFGIKISVDPIGGRGLENDIYYFGTYEHGTLSILKKNLCEGDIFFDIGANIGWISCVVSGFVGKSGKVYAFEPHPRIYEIFKNNIKINNINNIFTYNIALGSKIYKTKIYDIPNMNRGSASLISPTGIKKDGFKINVTTIDSLIENGQIPIPKLIKIDVEGFELKVLKGAKKLLKNSQAPIICLEYSTLHPQSGGDINKIYTFIKSVNNYSCYKLNYSKEVPGELIKISEIADLPRHDNIFCFLDNHLHDLQQRMKIIS
jgi:FkbM family methyltransferase